MKYDSKMWKNIVAVKGIIMIETVFVVSLFERTVKEMAGYLLVYSCSCFLLFGISFLWTKRNMKDKI
jgi:hypothetical protein